MFALTTSGLFQSSNEGTSWQYALNGVAPQRVYALVISPDFEDDKTLFAGTDNGVLKSTDGGKSWVWCNTGISSSTPPSSDYSVEAIGISPSFATDKTLMLGTAMSTLWSNDGGASWNKVNNASGVYGGYIVFSQIVFSPDFAKDKTIFGAHSGGGGIFYSTDDGVSWVQLGTPAFISSLTVSSDFANDHTMLAINSGALSLSTDSGNSWNKLNLGSTSAQVVSAAMSPQFSIDHTLFASTWNSNQDISILRSTNSGVSWKPIYTGNGISAAINSLAISPSFAKDHTVFAGYYSGGISRSVNSGDTWQDMSYGLPLSDMSPIAVSPDFSNDHTLFGLTNSQGLFRSQNSGNLWQHVGTDGNSFGSSIAFSSTYATDHTLFAVGGTGISRSTDSGGTWEACNSGLTATTDYADGQPAISIDAMCISPDFGHDHTLYVGVENSGIYCSTDGGNSWSQLDLHFKPTLVMSIAVSPSFATDNTLFVCTDTQAVTNLLMSTDRGDSWHDISDNLNKILYEGNIVTLSPAFAQDHTMICNSWSDAAISKDGGSSWIKISPAGELRINSAAFSPNYQNDKTFFEMTNGGLYYSTDGGNSWQQIPNLQNAWIECLVFSPAFSEDHIIFAGTSSGMFKGVFTAMQISH